MNSTLYETALEVLKNRPHRVTYAQISEKTKIGESWIRAFASGAIEKPSSQKLEALIGFFGKKVKVI